MLLGHIQMETLVGNPQLLPSSSYEPEGKEFEDSGGEKMAVGNDSRKRLNLPSLVFIIIIIIIIIIIYHHQNHVLTHMQRMDQQHPSVPHGDSLSIQILKCSPSRKQLYSAGAFFFGVTFFFSIKAKTNSSCVISSLLGFTLSPYYEAVVVSHVVISIRSS
ncbi:hypothetical protein STEG23_004698 [Scotinomys teguina]